MGNFAEHGAFPKMNRAADSGSVWNKGRQRPSLVPRTTSWQYIWPTPKNVNAASTLDQPAR